jgi:diguanylate cyclase (GGDEF)-like protein/PAS domain S-box-containing protein
MNSDALAWSVPSADQNEIGQLIASFDRLLGALAEQDKVIQAGASFKQSILNAVSQEIAVLARDGTILAVNEAWRRFGRENSPVPGSAMPTVEVGANYLVAWQAHDNAPESLTAACVGIEAVQSGRLPRFHLEYECHSPGEQRWFSMNVTPLGVPGEGGVVITHTNITERRLAHEQQRLAASVFTHAREGIIITLPDGTIVDVNEAFTRITGYARGDVLGKNPRILSSGRQDRAFYYAMWQALLQQGHWVGEVWNRRKNGEVYAEMLTISAVRDSQGAAQHFVALFSDITTQKQQQTQLEHIAHYDALTDLPNRVLLADRLRHGLVQTHRRGQVLAVAFLDLDGFKAVNDQHGHHAGDHMLIALAARMKHVLRDGDTLARMGGDEFVAVIVDLDRTSDCLPLLTRLLAVAALPVQFGEAVLQVSASLGVTFFPQAAHLDAEQLLRQADQAMYQAKLEGKNRYRVFG